MPNYKKDEANGGYVFISHAHKDIHEIRQIRNTLEEKGLEPICFYLRCISDDNEVLDLIKREIDARDWFLLVDSKNARESKWVQTEVDYIRSQNPKKIVSVSLDNQEGILPVLDRLSKSMKVYLCYSHKDFDIAEAIYKACVKRDFKIFWDEDILCGEDWTTRIENEMSEVAKRGCVVLIVTKNSLASEYIKSELEFALSKDAFVLPIIVDDLSDMVPFRLSGKQYYQLKTPVSSEQIEEIVDLIEKLSLKRLNENQ